MNGKTKFVVTLTTALFAIIISIVSYWAGQVQGNTEMLHKIDKEVTTLEANYVEILRRLDSLDRKIP